MLKVYFQRAILLVGLLVFVACQKALKPSFSIKVQKSNVESAALLNSFSMGLPVAQFTNLFSLPEDKAPSIMSMSPNDISDFDCMGVMFGYLSNVNRGSCMSKSLSSASRIIPVAEVAGLYSFVNTQEQVVNFNEVLSGEEIELNVVGFQKPTAAQTCVTIDSQFAPEDLGYSKAYILASKVVNTGSSQDVLLNTGFYGAATNEYIDECDASIIDKQPETANLLTNIAAYYPMDALSGSGPYDVEDVTGNNENMNSTNGTLNSSGVINDFLAYDNANIGPNAKNQNLGNPTVGEDLSFSIWLKAGSVSQTQDVSVLTKVATSGSNHDGFIFGFNSSSYPSICHTYGTNHQVYVFNSNASCYFTDSVWHHFVLKMDSSTNTSSTKIEIYQDNNSCGVSNLSNVPTSSTGGTLYVNRAFGFCSVSMSTDYDGGMDEFGIWKRLLTPFEIQKLYNSGSGLAFSNFTN
jgi:hypothetical protein